MNPTGIDRTARCISICKRELKKGQEKVIPRILGMINARRVLTGSYDKKTELLS